MLSLATFGNNKSDMVLAEHLNEYPKQAGWACRAISKTTSLLHELEAAGIDNRRFARTIYSLIRASMLAHVNNPPEHISEKTKTYTANIVTRHLRLSAESFK